MIRSTSSGLVAASLFVSAVAAAQPAAEDTDSTPAESGTGAITEPKPDAAAEPKPESSEKPAPTAHAATGPKAFGDLGEKTPFTLQPFGFLRLQYIVVQNDPNVAFVGRDDGFELQNARFGIKGAYADKVRYVMSIDGAIDERAQQNTPQGKLRVGLRDAYADVLASGQLFIRGGFFQTWADPMRIIPDTSRYFVDQPLWSRGMRSTEGWYTPGLTPGRSLGAALRLEPTTANSIGFEVAVQNGADEYSSNNDNDLPAASAAFMYKLDGDGFIVIGGRYNPRTVGDLPFRQDETDIQGTFATQVDAGPIRFGGGGILQKTLYQSTGGPDQDAWGTHAEFLVKIPASNPLWVGYRFAMLDPSSLIVTDRVMEHTAGGVMSVPSLHMRVQLQAVHVVEQAARQLSNSRVQLAAEVAL